MEIYAKLEGYRQQLYEVEEGISDINIGMIIEVREVYPLENDEPWQTVKVTHISKEKGYLLYSITDFKRRQKKSDKDIM